MSTFKCTFASLRAISSVGLEHRLDRAGVTGSNPVLPTKKTHSFEWVFYINKIKLLLVFGLNTIENVQYEKKFKCCLVEKRSPHQ